MMKFMVYFQVHSSIIYIWFKYGNLVANIANVKIHALIHAMDELIPFFPSLWNRNSDPVEAYQELIIWMVWDQIYIIYVLL